MLKVGFTGGQYIFETGPVVDMSLFFKTIDVFIKNETDIDWTLITDRLYKKYLKEEELAKAQELMDKIHQIFRAKPPSAVEWDIDEDLYESIELDFNSETLADMFARYFYGFYECCGSVEALQKIMGDSPDYKYDPIMVVHASTTRSIDHRRIPLETRDNLKPEDPPFWKLD